MWHTIRWNTSSFPEVPFPIPSSHKTCSSLCQFSHPSSLQPAWAAHQYFSVCKWTVSPIPSETHVIGVVFWHVSVLCTEVILKSPAVTRKCGFTEDRSCTTRLLHSGCSPARWWLLPVGSVLFASCRVTPSLTGRNSDLFSFAADFINCGVGYSKRGEWGGAPLPYSQWVLHNPQLRNAALDRTASAFGVLVMILTWLFKYPVW